MASTVKHLRSSTADKRPTASGLADGQLAINTASGTPGLFLKDNAGAVVKVGPVHVGAAAPNATPAGSSGNSKGELWVNDTTTIHGLNYFSGSAFVNLTPSGTTTAAGLVELATDAETQTGTDIIRAVTPSGLQSKVSDSTSTTSSTTIASSTAVKAAFDLANAALPKSGGRVTGNLEIGPTGSLSFEGSTDDNFETFLAVVDPTADRTITFPNVTGTVVTTGDTGTVTSTMITDGTIVNADINASAGIVDTKLATISTAGKVSNSATTAVSTNTVNAIVTRDGSGNFSAGTITAALTGNASTATKLSSPRTFAVTGDIAGTVSSDLTSGASIATSIAAGVIIDADVNASAAIGLSKLATGALPSGITVASANIVDGTIVNADINASAAIALSKLATGALPSAITVASTNIVDGTIVNADVNASAAIAGTKIAPNFGSQTITTTGVISPALGTAAAPSIAFTGDLNTGIYSPGADQVAVATNGTGRLFVDATGRVGIGTASPAQTLDIAGTAGLHLRGTTYTNFSDYWGNSDSRAMFLPYGFLGSSGSFAVSLYANGYRNASSGFTYMGINGNTSTAAGLDLQPDGNILFRSGTAVGAALPERLRITSAGLVGIGTSSPGAGLHIVSTGQTTANLDTSANINTIISDNGSAVGNGGSLVFAAASGTWRFAAIKGLVTSGTSNTTGNLTFSTRNANTDATLTERLRITSTGNVGIGTTSPGALLAVSASDSSALGASILLSNPQSDANLQITAAGTSFSQAGWPVITDAALIRSSAGASGGLGLIAGAASSPITFFQADQERARIDSSGRLLVGTSSAPPAVETLTPGFALSSSGSAQDGYTAGIYCYRNAGGSGRQTVGPKLFFGRSRSGTNGSTGTVVIDGENIGDIRFAGDDGSKFVTAAEIRAFVDGTPGADDMPGRLVFSTTADGASSPTERMRITSGGEALIGKQVADNTTSGLRLAPDFASFVRDGNIALLLNRLSSDGNIVDFRRSSTVVGSISVTTTATAYNTSSDYRLKENVTSVTDGITRLQQLKPSRFNFIADPDTVVDGFLAHEVQDVVPEAITGEKDAVDDDGNPEYQGIDQSKLVPLLTAALQEAIAKIEILEQRLNDAGIN
jgi:hypothetical protein